jgi:hypothetical protein
MFTGAQIFGYGIVGGVEGYAAGCFTFVIYGNKLLLFEGWVILKKLNTGL